MRSTVRDEEMTLEENDKQVVRAGGGDEVIELALMFDLTGQEMEAVEDAGSAQTDGAGWPGSEGEVVQADWAARETMTRQTEGEQWGAFSHTAVMERGGESTSLQEVDERDATGVDAGLAWGGAAGVEQGWKRPGLTARQSGITRLASEFLGPPPGGPLPETPVMEVTEPLFPEEELPTAAADSEPPLHEMDEVSPHAAAWAEPAVGSSGGQTARRVMPWLPSVEGESAEGLLRETAAAVGRGGASRHATGAQPATRLVGRSDLEDTEPFDLQHVALITEGKARKDVFRRTENLGEEIIVRLTLPSRAAEESTEPVASRSAEVQRFSPETLVSVFAQSAAEEWESAEQAVPEDSLEQAVPAEPVVAQSAEEPLVEMEVAVAAEVAADSAMPWVGVAEEEPAATIPVWQAGEVAAVTGSGTVPPLAAPEPLSVESVHPAVGTQAAAGSEAEPPLEVLEPFSVDSIRRVARSRVADAGAGVQAAVVTETRRVEWGENPWGMDDTLSVAQVVVRETVAGGTGRDGDAGGSARHAAAAGQREEAVSLVNRVEPFDEGQLLGLARESLAREAEEPPVYGWDDNPWNFEQLPPGVTDRETRPTVKPAVAPALKVEVKASRVQPPVAPRSGGARVEATATRVAPKPVAAVSSVRPPAAAAPAAPPAAAAGRERTGAAALEVELLSAIRESARVARESAHVVRESAILTVESANAIRRAAQASRTGVAVPPEGGVARVPPPVSGSDRVVVPVEHMFVGISNALGDVVGSVIGRRRVRRG
ncbi:MAG: hypothetical protein H7836_03210 [Magnetococcus sp. YQC-3]